VKKPPKKVFVAAYSPNFIVGATFMHYALQAVGVAFLAGGK